MQVSDSEFNLILAALRVASMGYEARAQELQPKDPRGALQAAHFAKACGELSNRLERDRPRSGLILPN
jgi:hypothetical protein